MTAWCLEYFRWDCTDPSPNLRKQFLPKNGRRHSRTLLLFMVSFLEGCVNSVPNHQAWDCFSRNCSASCSSCSWSVIVNLSSGCFLHAFKLCINRSVHASTLFKLGEWRVLVDEPWIGWWHDAAGGLDLQPITNRYEYLWWWPWRWILMQPCWSFPPKFMLDQLLWKHTSRGTVC